MNEDNRHFFNLSRKITDRVLVTLLTYWMKYVTLIENLMMNSDKRFVRFAIVIKK